MQTEGSEATSHVQSTTVLGKTPSGALGVQAQVATSQSLEEQGGLSRRAGSRPTAVRCGAVREAGWVAEAAAGCTISVFAVGRCKI